MPDAQFIDFEIIKEPWNKYQISDGSVLKTRIILTEVERVMKGTKPEFSVNSQTLVVLSADPSLKGEPSTERHTAREIEEAIERKDIRYDTLSQEFNEYILDDGTKIKIYSNITNIDRTKLHNAKGNPIYKIAPSIQIEIKPSNLYGAQ